MEKDVAEIFNVLNPNDNKDDYKKDNLDVVMLYVVDGGLSTDAAVMEVADELNKEMEDLVRSYNTKVLITLLWRMCTPTLVLSALTPSLWMPTMARA